MTRSGIVPAPGNPLRVSQSSPLGMSARVNPGNTEIHRVGRGSYRPYNDAVAMVSFDPAPAQNSRWDLVYLAQADSEVDGGASTSTLGVLSGEAKAIPDKPFDKLPAGSLVLAEVGPIVSTTTQITDALIANVAPFTAVRGAPIMVWTQVERDDLSLIASAAYPITVERLDTGTLERNAGFGWAPVLVTPGWTTYVPSLTGVTLGDGAVTGEYLRVGPLVHCQGVLTFGANTVLAGAALGIGVPLPWADHSNNSVHPVGVTSLFDVSTNGMRFWWARPSAGSACIVAGPNGETLSATAPWAWSAGDSVRWNLTYRTSAA